MNKKIKILMCSFPNNGRGPGNAFYNHFLALRNSKEFEIELITDVFTKKPELFDKYDIYWFSIRFHPSIYYFLKKNFPEKKFIMGPNVLFEKAEIGPSDEWEKWFVKNVNCNYYFNKADFYLKRVQHFYSGSENYKVLANCLDLTNLEENRAARIKNKPNKVLVYSKKRRIDSQFDNIFPKFINFLNNNNVEYDIVKYGNYKKEDLIKKVKDYSVCFWFSIEDFCSNAQLEIQSIGTPIIGSKFNLTHTADKSLVLKNAALMSNDWIKWNPDVSKIYYDKYLQIKDTLNEKKSILNRIEYIEKEHSYSAYVKNLTGLIT
jgi:hypothetical protein